MFEDGGVEARVRLVRPAAREPMAAKELAASNWEDAHGDSWRALWDAEIDGLPSHTESRLWLVTGLLLPIWDRLPGENMRVRRACDRCRGKPAGPGSDARAGARIPRRFRDWPADRS